ncbi:MAG: hypothetical protein AB8B97_00680 [Granulosicoccus sp.]
MSQNLQILLLPLAALALAVLFPLFGKNHSLSSSWKSKRRRRVIRGRIAVVSLLVGTILTELFPIDGVNVLVQGLAIAAAVMIPGCLIHWYLSMRYSESREEKSSRRSRRSDEALSMVANEASFVKKEPSEHTVSSATPANDSPKAPDLKLVDGTPSASAVAPAVAAVATSTVAMAAAAKTSVKSSVATAIKPDNSNIARASRDEVREHLAKVADNVQSHDLDPPGFKAPDAPDAERKVRESRDKRVASNTSLMPTSGHPSDLSKLSTEQIQGLIVSLSEDKNRLQRLVIAQQASIESEREAHDQTRVLTRDAIKVMRSARTAQKHAEKLARRERSERQRIEQQYTKVASSLRNAMSIIEKRRSALSSNDAIPTLSSNIKVDKILS